MLNPSDHTSTSTEPYLLPQIGKQFRRYRYPTHRIYSPGYSELLDSETHFSHPTSPGSSTMSCGADVTITIFDRIDAFVRSSSP
jgi:hypothetical protein